MGALVSARHIAVLAIIIACAACAPALPGPQLRRLPPGLGYVTQVGEPRGDVLGRKAVLQRAWVSPTEPGASLSLSACDGRATRADLDAWLEAHPEKYAERGPVREARIDSRPSWVWVEKGKASMRAWAVVPYDDATFMMSFYTARSEQQDERLLLDALESFDRDPGASERVLVPLVALALAGAAVLAVRRFRSPPPPPRVVSRPAPPPPSPLARGPGR